MPPAQGPWGSRWDAKLGTVSQHEGRLSVRLLPPQRSTPEPPADPALSPGGTLPDLSAIDFRVEESAAPSDAGAGTWQQALVDHVQWPDALLPEGQEAQVRVFWQRGAQGELVAWESQTSPGLTSAFEAQVRSALDRAVDDPAAQRQRGCWTVRFDAREHRIDLQVHAGRLAETALACLGFDRNKRR